MVVWIEQNLSLIISGSIGLAAFLILLFTYLKDLESTKRLDKFEIAIDNLHDEIYRLQKWVKKIEGEQEEKIEQFQTQVQNQTQNIVTKSLGEAFEHLENIEQKVNDKIQLATDNLSHLDGRIKELGFLSSSATSLDEKKIIALLQEGKNADAIAKELGITCGEVELFLQLSDITYNKGSEYVEK